MIRIALCLGALLPISGLFSASAAAQDSSTALQKVDLLYKPKAGERLRHTWLADHKLFATEVLSRIEGKNPVAVTQLPALTTRERRVTTDWIQDVENNRITKMRRTWANADIWGKLDFHVASQPAVEVVLKSPMANPSTSVVFTYVPEEKYYGKYFDQSAMTESLLAGIRLDNSCSSLLPGKAVAIGDSWDVEVDQLLSLLAPTGAMDYRQVKPGGAMLIRTLLMGVGGCAENVWNPSNLQGHLRCTLVKVAGSGALALAHIQVDYKFATSQDRSAAARELQMLGENQRGTVVLHNSVMIGGEGQGTLIWNMNLNRVHSYTLRGTEVLEMEVKTQALDRPVVTQKMKLRGTSEVKYGVSKVSTAGLAKPWTENPPVRIEPVGPQPTAD